MSQYTIGDVNERCTHLGVKVALFAGAVIFHDRGNLIRLVHPLRKGWLNRRAVRSAFRRVSRTLRRSRGNLGQCDDCLWVPHERSSY